MPKRSTRRLPKKFARKASKETKRYVQRTLRPKKRKSQEKWKRVLRRTESAVSVMRASMLRWILVLLLSIGLVVLGFILFSPVMHIREIVVARESPRLDIEHVQESLAPMFSRHLFFVSSFEIANLLKDSIPDIDHISTSKIYPSTLHVGIGLTPLVAKLVIAEPDVEYAASSGAVIDFLTDNGVYIVTTSAKDIETLPTITVVDWGVRPEVGTVLIDPLFMERMNAAELTLLRQFGQETTRRTMFLRAQEFHLQIGDIELWFDLRSPLKDQIERYRLFLREESLDVVSEYIDLRVIGRVVYK